MTRTGNFKRTLALIMCIVMMLGTMPFAAAASFSDTEGHWAEAAIERWSGYGVLKGDENGEFRPDAPITRAELAAVLNRIISYTQTGNASFADVSAGDWFYDDVDKLYAAGIMQGDGAGVMRPNDNITREEAVALIARAFSVEGAGSASFPDADKISSWAAAFVAAMQAAGYIGGDENGNFNPGNPITRAELVTILDRMIALYISAAGEVDGTELGKLTANGVISAGDTQLKNFETGGDLYIMEGVGSGSVTLDSVTADTLYIRGGSDVTIAGTSSFGDIVVDKNVKLSVESGAKTGDVLITKDAGDVTLDGEFGNVVSESGGALDIGGTTVEDLTVNGGGTIKTDGKTKVGELTLGGKATVTGSGDIDKVTVPKAADGSSFATQPDTIVLAGGTSVKVGDTTYTNTTDTDKTIEKGKSLPAGVEADKKTTGGGGGGTGGGNSNFNFEYIQPHNFYIIEGSIYIYSLIDYDLDATTGVTVAVTDSGDTISVIGVYEASASGGFAWEVILNTPLQNSETYTLTISRSGYNTFSQTFTYPVKAPTDVEWASSGGVQTGELTWTGVTGVEYYEIYLYAVDAGSNEKLIDVYTTTDTSYDLLAVMKNYTPSGSFVVEGFTAGMYSMTGVLSSERATASSIYTPPALPAPTGVAFDIVDEEVSFTGIGSSYASDLAHYLVSIYKNDAATPAETVEVSASPVDVSDELADLGSGEYTFSVTAIPKDDSIYWYGTESAIVAGSEATLIALDKTKVLDENTSGKIWDPAIWGDLSGIADRMLPTYAITDTDIEATGAIARVDSSELQAGVWPANEMGGYYVMFSMDIPLTSAELALTSGTIIKIGTAELTKADLLDTRDGKPVFELWLYLGDDFAAAKLVEKTITVDWDGSGTAYSPTTYTLSFSGLTKMSVTESAITNSDLVELDAAKIDAQNNAGSGIWDSDIWGDLEKISARMLPEYEIEDATIKFEGGIGLVDSSEIEAGVWPVSEMGGYYVMFSMKVPAAALSVTDTVITMGNLRVAGNQITDTRGSDAVFELWLYLGDDFDAAKLAKKTITVDWDGSGTACIPTTYTMDFSGLTLTPPADTDVTDSQIETLTKAEITSENGSGAGNIWDSDIWGDISGAVDKILPAYEVSGTDIIASGTLGYLESTDPALATGWGSTPSAGYYAMFRMEIDDAAIGSSGTILQFGSLQLTYDDIVDWRDGKKSFEMWLYLGADITTAKAATKEIIVDWDGDGAAYSPVTYTLKFTGIENMTLSGDEINDLDKTTFLQENGSGAGNTWDSDIWGDMSGLFSKMMPSYELEGTTIKATGTLSYILGSELTSGWGSAPSDGYYALFCMEIPAAASTSSGYIIQTGNLNLTYSDITDERGGNKVFELWVYLGTDLTTATRTITVDWDGDGSAPATTYTIDFSGVTPIPTP